MDLGINFGTEIDDDVNTKAGFKGFRMGNYLFG